MAQKRSINTNVDEIFHGLCIVTIVPGRYLSALKPLLPTNVIKIGGAQSGQASEQSEFLTGGAPGSPGTGASKAFTLDGDIVTPRTTFRITFHQIVVDLVPQDVTIEVDVEEGDTLTTIAANIVLACNYCVDGEIPEEDNIRYYAADDKATKELIAAGMAAVYGESDATPAPFSNTGATVTVKALASLAAGGNNYDFTVEWKPAPPTILSIDGEGFAVGAAGLQGLGYTEGLTLNVQATEQNIDTDQSYFPVDTYITGSSAEISLNALQNLNPRTFRLASGYTGIASSHEHEVMIMNFLRRQQTFGMIVTTASQKLETKWNVLVALQVGGNGFNFGQKKQNEAMQLKLNAKPPAGRNDLLYLQIPRPTIHAAAA